MLTRLFIRKDGVIVFSHSQVGFEGIHLLYPVQKIRRYIERTVFQKQKPSTITTAN